MEAYLKDNTGSIVPKGRIASDPSLASGEDGEKIYAAATQDVYESYRAFLEE